MTSPLPVDLVRSLVAGEERRLVGIVGAPGSGKSTLANELAATHPGRAIVLPMDGFHLAQAELERLGRAARKGAPDTFDVAGFVALLRRVRQRVAGETVYAPGFRREIEEPVAGMIAIPPDVSLVIVEGNYLLLDGPWAPVATLLDESWYLETPDLLRNDWLQARHVQFGRSRQAASAWIAAIDTPNARLIEATKVRASRRFQWPPPARMVA